MPSAPDRPAQRILQPMREIARRTAHGFGHDELSTRAAALAFCSTLSFAPLLVLLLWIADSLKHLVRAPRKR